HIEENHASVVPAALYPATQGNFFPVIPLPEVPAIVATHHLDRILVINQRSCPQKAAQYKGKADAAEAALWCLSTRCAIFRQPRKLPAKCPEFTPGRPSQTGLHAPKRVSIPSSQSLADGILLITTTRLQERSP